MQERLYGTGVCLGAAGLLCRVACLDALLLSLLFSSV